ncbi:MAG TPA: DUF4388 domain-containing protein [Ktedonobacteraceae bacterium]|nr:DUF4388 domain-containing protein [Ktedonobacteraceae bacterium]
MPELRYTATDQLANVIDAIQIGRKTGILTATRGEGERREEGNIVFVSGQVVRAALGYFLGAEALQNMLGWTTCQFVFSPGTNTPVPVFMSPMQRSPVAEQRQTDEQTAFLFITPYRIRDVNIAEMDRRGLSRTHRRLFLLLDGQRSIKDLMVLMGRPPNEIFMLLNQLERAGFIRQ